MWRLSWNLGASAFLEPSGPVRACTRFALEFHFFYFFLWRCSPTRTTVSSFLSFLNHKQRPSKVTRMSDQLFAENYTWQHTTYKKHPYLRRDSNLQSQQAIALLLILIETDHTKLPTWCTEYYLFVVLYGQFMMHGQRNIKLCDAYWNCLLRLIYLRSVASHVRLWQFSRNITSRVYAIMILVLVLYGCKFSKDGA